MKKLAWKEIPKQGSELLHGSNGMRSKAWNNKRGGGFGGTNPCYAPGSAPCMGTVLGREQGYSKVPPLGTKALGW